MPAIFTCEKCEHEIVFKNAFPQSMSLKCPKCGGQAWFGSGNEGRRVPEKSELKKSIEHGPLDEWNTIPDPKEENHHE